MDGFEKENRPIHKLTQEPVSEEFLNVLARLRTGEEVPEAEIKALPEIKFADACISNSKPTIEIEGREIIQENVYNRLQKMGSAVTKSDGTVELNGEVRCDKRLDIVIGLPAAGKSSAVAEPISELFKSRIIDCDEAKKMLPGFDGGWGAQAVHLESQRISDRQLKSALKNGENITYPRVGAGYETMKKVIDDAKRAGYKVYVHYNELDRNKALGRMLERFLMTGRYLKPDLITGVGDNIGETYKQLKKSGLIEGFTKWNNDVPFGERPKSIEHSASCTDVYETLREKKPETVKERAELHDAVIDKLTVRIDKLEAELAKVTAERDNYLAKLEEVGRVFKQLPPEFAKRYIHKRAELREADKRSPPTIGKADLKPPKPKNPKH